MIDVWSHRSDPKKTKYCIACLKIQQQKKQSKCQGCDWGHRAICLMEENAEAMDFWEHIQTQWRAAAFGLVGLDYPAIRGEARELGLYLSPGLFSKLQALEKYELQRINHVDSGQGNAAGSKKAQPRH